MGDRTRVEGRFELAIDPVSGERFESVRRVELDREGRIANAQ